MKTTRVTMLSLSLLALIASGGSVVRAQAMASPGWVTAGANPQRTSWVPDAAPGLLKPIWVKPVEPYISQKVQIITTSGKLFLSTARGLYAFDADTGADLWVYPTALPLGHSPTYAGGRIYVGGLDRKIHALDADTGRGLWTFSAAGGFHTCPLVVEGLVYAGSRDGFMYAVDANSGELAWKHQTGGQILQSAAYQDGVIFFGSQDARVYALDARTGAQVWRSDKLPGMGWHSWWPVIYKDVVLFTRTEVEKGLVGFQNDWAFSKNKTAKNLPGVRGAEPGDWAAGEPTVDIRTNPNGGTIPDWFEQYRWRRSLIVLDRKTGAEVAFDLDNDGVTDAAPMLWGWTHGGTCYPPLVSGRNGVIYFRSMSHATGGGIPGAVMVGWKYGTPFLSLPVSNMSGQSGFWPGDEPVGISAGGSHVYWNLCNDRFIGSANLDIANAAWPDTDGRRQWRHMSGNGLDTSTLPAGYNSQVFQYLWSVGPANIKPMYWAHGDNVGPTIHAGKMYVHRGNAIVAFSPTGLGSSAPVLPVARIRPGGIGPEPLSEMVLRERLATEVGKILDQGHLMAGFAKIGLIDFLTVTGLGDYLLHYWHDPADTQITLFARPASPARGNGGPGASIPPQRIRRLSALQVRAHRIPGWSVARALRLSALHGQEFRAQFRASDGQFVPRLGQTASQRLCHVEIRAGGSGRSGHGVRASLRRDRFHPVRPLSPGLSACSQCLHCGLRRLRGVGQDGRPALRHKTAGVGSIASTAGPDISLGRAG